MRTTLTIDDRIAKASKALAHRSCKPFKCVVNKTLQVSLAAAEAPPKARPYRIKPVSMGGVVPGIDLTKALSLADTLEDAEIIGDLRAAQVILVDANALIYAIDWDSPHHARARRWLEEALSGNTWVGLPWVVILAFIRVTTRAGIMRNSLLLDQALAFVDARPRQPYVNPIEPGKIAGPFSVTSSGPMAPRVTSRQMRMLPRLRSCTQAKRMVTSEQRIKSCLSRSVSMTAEHDGWSVWDGRKRQDLTPSRCVTPSRCAGEVFQRDCGSLRAARLRCDSFGERLSLRDRIIYRLGIVLGDRLR